MPVSEVNCPESGIVLFRTTVRRPNGFIVLAHRYSEQTRGAQHQYERNYVTAFSQTRPFV